MSMLMMATGQRRQSDHGACNLGLNAASPTPFNCITGLSKLLSQCLAAWRCSFSGRHEFGRDDAANLDSQARWRFACDSRSSACWSSLFLPRLATPPAGSKTLSSAARHTWARVRPQGCLSVPPGPPLPPHQGPRTAPPWVVYTFPPHCRAKSIHHPWGGGRPTHQRKSPIQGPWQVRSSPPSLNPACGRQTMATPSGVTAIVTCNDKPAIVALSVQ